jgi:cardiolipin synthase
VLAAGARVFEYQPSTLHAKTFVADGAWVSVGTTNFDNRSLSLNDEATLLVLDPALGREVERVFLDDLRYAEEIDLAAFRTRPRLARVGEWSANLIEPLL